MQVRFHLVAILFLACVASSTAATIQCADVPGAIVFNPNNILFTYDTWTAPAFECEQQDKIYSDFSPGTIPADTTLRLQLQNNGSEQLHTVSFGGDFTSIDFIVRYMITLDTAISPNLAIVRVTGDILNSGGGSPSNVKEVTGSGGFSGSLTSTTGDPGGTIAVPNLLALGVTDTFSAGGGAVQNIANTFVEGLAAVPEPSTMTFIGVGMLAIGWTLKRRRTP